MPIRNATREWIRTMPRSVLAALSSFCKRDNLTRWACGISTWTLLSVSGSAVLAEESSDPIEEFRLRIARLEQDNRELRSALSKYEDPFVPLMADLPPMPDAMDEYDSSGDPKMDSLVNKWLHNLAVQSKANSDAQDQRIAALESKVSGLNKPPKPTSSSGNFGNSGLLFSSADGNFKAHLGGTAQLDFIAPESQASNIVIPGGAGTQDATNFRRLRMRADGTMWGNIDWVSEFDMAGFVQNTNNSQAALADNGLRSVGVIGGVQQQQGGNSLNVIQPTTVWMTFKDVPMLGNVRVGNQQDWFSIEHIESARYLDFMERAPIMDAFSGPNNNGYTPGVSFFNNTPNKMAGLQLGVYKNNAYDSGYTFSVGNAFTYGGRAIWTPYYDEESEGRYMVHTGFGTEYRTFNTTLAPAQDGQNIRLRSRGDLRNVSATLDPNFTDTGNFFATGQAMIDPEIAVVWGPWLFQAEWTSSWFNGARTTQNGGVPLDNVFMHGGYAETLYFLTGENRVYNRQTGTFNQVVPKNNVNFCEGKYGAWQLGVRYDWMDMNSGLITGGRNQNGTIGLNWFLNPNVRFQFNAVFSYIDNAPNNPAIPGAATIGSLQGAKFTGEGLITTLGTRMDISF